MKRCPECRRDYYDDSLLYCLDDGSALLEGPSSDRHEEPRTALLHDTHAVDEAATRAQVQTTGEKVSVGEADARTTRGPARSAVAIGLVVMVALAVGGFITYKYVGPGKQRIGSVAVLPFQLRSEDPDTDYLSEGLAESLIFRLTQLPGLKVSPTSSVFRYKGTQIDASSVARELGVDAVLTGRMTKRGDNLNITVELVDARNNTSLWGEQYERKMSDLLATQREIAATIADKLQLKLTGADATGITKKYTDNNEAYQLYLKGRVHFARRTKADMEKSVELLQQATSLDPSFALAYVGIAESYTSMPSYPYMAPTEAAPRAQTAIDKALSLDPDLPEAHAVAGMIASSAWDYPKAESEFKRALELGPNLAITHYRYGWMYLSIIGKHDAAVAELKRAVEIEPLAVQQGANYAATLMYARRLDEAIDQARKVRELDPSHLGARNWLCYTLVAKGQYAEARDVGEKALQADPTLLPWSTQCLGLAYAGLGDRQKAVNVIQQAKERARDQYMMTYTFASIYAVMGDKDAAFAELEMSFKNHDWFLNRLKVDPFMDKLRADPRFDAMVKRLNLPD